MVLNKICGKFTLANRSVERNSEGSYQNDSECSYQNVSKKVDASEYLG